MVQLFEQYRLVHKNKHQFLGDLFEQLLNKGFKQNEGQFFTPSPITRFIWDCLPLKHILAEHDGYPKVIDYACGSAHFLTEAVEAINAAKPAENNDWTRESIYGIEKDYRLARVSKVSMFMNGVDKSNIIFGDGLDNAKEKGVENDSFDILVANPPYSVSAFKSHLKLKNNTLSLLDHISNNGGEIEVLFCERIAQLLKSGGIGAVILPSSILSNDSGSYTAARALLLNEFHLRAVVNFGSKTFGATGTNTVVLFLEKRSYPPSDHALAEDNANAIFGDAQFLQEKDKAIFTAYLQHLGVSEEQYNPLRHRTASWEKLLGDLGSEYLNAQAKAILSQIKLSKTQEKLPIAEQQAVKSTAFFAKFVESEKARIALFALLYHQQTLVINAPSDNAKQKEFLGYDWSNRKGAEGIQILNEGGKLYNAQDRFAENTLAALVRSAFGKNVAVKESQKEYAYWVNSVDMIDFSGVNFNKAIRTVETKKLEINSKYPMVTIEEITSTIETGKRPSGGVGLFSEGAYSLGGEHIGKDNGRLDLTTIKYVPQDFFNTAQKGIIKSFDILLCKDGALTGKVCLVRNELDGIDAMINEHVFILRCNELDTQKYLFNYLYSEMGQLQLKANITGSAQGGLNSTNLKKIKIPLPPLNIQQEICKKCEEIDRLYENSRMKIEEYRNTIRTKLHHLYANAPKRIKLSDDLFSLSIGQRVLEKEFVENGTIPAYSANVITPFGKVDKLLFTEFDKPSVLWGIDGDWMTNCVPKDYPFYPTDHCGVLRILQDGVLVEKYVAYALAQEGKAFNFSRTLRASIARVKSLSIPVPDFAEQQKIVHRINRIEQAISILEQRMAGTAEQKKAVLAAYL